MHDITINKNGMCNARLFKQNKCAAHRLLYSGPSGFWCNFSKCFKINIKNMNGASSSGTKSNEVGNDQAVDFFSSLPDNIFTNIFSLLTMKEAFYTCISCKKLKHLMNSIANIEFKETADNSLTKKREFVQLVTRFLDNHESFVRKFQLSFRPGEYNSVVLHWLSMVVKNGMEELDLTFDYRNHLEISVSLLTAAGTLKVLKLRHCIVDLPSITGLKSLKSLLLGNMYISDNVMGLLCCHCESLQYLLLEECLGFEVIEIVDPRSKLKTLVLDGRCLSLSRLNILSLETLIIRKRYMNFSFVGCPHIDDLVLYREAVHEITHQESENMKTNIINRLADVRTLHLVGLAFECAAAYRSIENHQFTNLEFLILDVNVSLKNLKELNNLISQAKGLKSLLLSVHTNSARDYTIYTDRNFETVSAYFLENEYEAKGTVGLSKYNAGVSNSALQYIDIKGFTGTIYEVSHIKFVLAHFPHLRVFTVTPITGIDEDQSRAYAKLFSRFRRVSKSLYMLVGSEEVWKAEEA